MKTLNQILKWTPRILGILFTVMITLFAFDVFGQGTGFWKTLMGLLMHLIPSFILILVLIFSWKRSWIGGISFILLGILYIVWSSKSGRGADFVYIILFVTGILFLSSWFLQKETRSEN